jgi:opacity protein-like surface antigen
MFARLALAWLLATTASVFARADDFAHAPAIDADANSYPSIWRGLYVGSEVFATAQKGSKGAFGGAAVAGYNHVFANNVVVGVEATTGYAPYSIQHNPRQGYDFAAADVKVGYEMGRLTPYVSTGFVLAKPNFGPTPGYFGGMNAANDLFNSPGALRGAVSVGAGFDYAVNNNLSVGLGVSMIQGRGPNGP